MSSRLSDPLAHAPALALRRTIPSQIADALALEIIEERYEPGKRLNEIEIAARWGVSRSPVREALRILEKRGLIVMTPQRGARVTLLSQGEVEQLFEIRSVLVGLAARRAAMHVDGSAALSLDLALSQLDRSLGDAEQYERASASATLEMARIGASPPLMELIASFADRIGRYARLGLASAARRKKSISLWRALVEAIQSGDGERAERTCRQLALENRDEAIKVLRDRVNHLKPVSRSSRSSP